jgi:hypothetical protein
MKNKIKKKKVKITRTQFDILNQYFSMKEAWKFFMFLFHKICILILSFRRHITGIYSDIGIKRKKKKIFFLQP